MDDYLRALLFAAMPAVGNFAGGLLAEMLNVSQRALSLALHLAAGIIIAVVAVELIPQALQAKPPWIPILCFVLGGAFSLLIDRLTDYIGARIKRSGGGDKAREVAGRAGPWAIFVGVAVDLFSDGVMIGTGSTLAVGLGLLLALGQVPADIPEGFATIATFKDQGVPRRTRLLLSAAFAVPIFLGVTVGYWAVRGLPEIYKLSLLAFVAGILLTVAVEEIVPQAHERGEDSRAATLLLVGGFALFALLSVYLKIE